MISCKYINDLFTEKVISNEKDLSSNQEIIDFNKTLNKDFSYGVVYKGKVITDLSEFNFFENYKSLTIREFEKYKTGICWDFVHYEANWFKKHGYKYETYYIEGLDKDGDPHTHTFLLFYLNDSSKTYYFESAWGDYQGIEEFDNTTKALKTIEERHIKDYKGDIKDIICVKIDLISTSFEGLSCEDYMIKASKGKTRLSVDDYKICYRVTYKGEGVYQALKNELTKTDEGRKIWKQFLDNEDWLDKPPSYGKNDKSYFIKAGFDKFKKSKDYKLIKKYLKDIDIEIIEINNKKIKYEDQYQVVVTESKEINIIPQEIEVTESEEFSTKLKKEDILNILKKFKYNKSEFCIVYKAALVLQGVVDSCNDIDLVISKSLHDKLISDGYNVEKAPLGGPKFTINKRLECFTEDDCDKDSIMCYGYKCKTIKHCLDEYKRRNREKDKSTIEAIEKFMKRNPTRLEKEEGL